MFEQQRSELDFNGVRLASRILIAVAVPVVAGLVAEAISAPEYAVVLAVTFVVVASFVRSFYNDKQRNKSQHQLANALGFTYAGTRLPFGFPWETTQRGSIRRVFVYPAGERDLLFFDSEYRRGRSYSQCTAVALRGKLAEFGFARFGPVLVPEEFAGWAVVRSERRFLEPAEISELVDAINPRA